jgi:hypothetical protein
MYQKCGAAVVLEARVFHDHVFDERPRVAKVLHVIGAVYAPPFAPEAFDDELMSIKKTA